MASIYDSLVSGTMGLVKGLPRTFTRHRTTSTIRSTSRRLQCNFCNERNDNMNAGLGSLIAPGALYTLGDTIANPNQGLVEGVQDFEDI